MLNDSISNTLCYILRDKDDANIMSLEESSELLIDLLISRVFVNNEEIALILKISLSHSGEKKTCDSCSVANGRDKKSSFYTESFSAHVWFVNMI